MKIIGTIGITVLLVAGLATSAFAFGPHWGGRGHYDHRPGYAHEWKHSGHGYEDGKHGRHTREQHYRHQEPSYGSGAGIALPLVPLPGISFWFPGISVNIH